jgi:hypothetical protein
MAEIFERRILRVLRGRLGRALAAAAISGLVACGEDSAMDAATAFGEIESKLQAASSVADPVERERAYEEALAAIYAAMRRHPSSEAAETLHRGQAVGTLSIPKIEESLGQAKSLNAQAMLARAQAQMIRGREECDTYDCHIEALRGALAIVEKLTQKYWETETGAAIRTPIVIDDGAAQLPDLAVENVRCLLATAEAEAAFKPRLEEIRALEDKGDAEANTTAKLSFYNRAREHLAAIESEAEALIAREVDTTAKPTVRDVQSIDAIPAPKPVCESRSWTLDRLFRHKYKAESIHGANATRLRDKTLEAARMVTGSRATETRTSAPVTQPRARGR